MLSIPKHKATLLLLTIVLYLVDPLLVIQHYETWLAAGAFPVESDSIIIPIARFLFGRIIIAPFLIALLWLSLKDYKGQTHFFGFNRNRFLWSSVWTVTLGLLAGFNIVMAIESFNEWRNHFYVMPYLLWAYVISYSLWAYILLCLRASIVYAKPFTKRQVLT